MSRKKSLPLLPEPIMSPLQVQVEQNSTGRTTLCISLACGLRRERRLCRQQIIDARCRCLRPECLIIVKSHTKHLPCAHGTSVKPSGRLPSFRDRHDGSSLTGISAAVSARFMRSLTALCREWRPADRRHDYGRPNWSKREGVYALELFSTRWVQTQRVDKINQSI